MSYTPLPIADNLADEGASPIFRVAPCQFTFNQLAENAVPSG
jgi:hypothetical protein